MASVSTINKFIHEAKETISKESVYQVNSLGGYGHNGDVIYSAFPFGCPSVLVDKQKTTTATFMSNGSVELKVVHENNNREVNVLRGSFDPVEKKEIGQLSTNIWLATNKNQIVSLLNSNINQNTSVISRKMIKRSSDRSMWHCNTLSFEKGVEVQSALKMQLVDSPKGPALIRSLFLKNIGSKVYNANLWLYLDLRGTQYFTYNKSAWYDAGLPLDTKTHVISASVPYSEMLQIKCIRNETASGIKILDGTCDYQNFIGDTSEFALFPRAIHNQKLLKMGAGKNLNRFSSPVISTFQAEVNLKPKQETAFIQSIQYITDEKLIAEFLKTSGAKDPTDKAISLAFKKASENIIKKTPTTTTFVEQSIKENAKLQKCEEFFIDLKEQKVISEYANSVWTTVEELYENCRAHGAKLADGIELGTRDRGQDMWPKMKDDPSIVRKDLIHALGFMIQLDEKIPTKGRLKLRHKLHGMFPRQFPSSWKNRTQEIHNDNRPYNDSPIWLVDSLNAYIRETGDLSILTEVVGSVQLTTPDKPETSGLIGHKNKFKIYQVVSEIFNCYKRHADDSPYGMIQILYGDWCDPVDMFGTGKVGDNQTRGIGTGVNVRLSSHVFASLIDTIDLFESKDVKKQIGDAKLQKDIEAKKIFASSLQKNVLKFGWEETAEGTKGFLDSIHELTISGKTPNYKKGQTGYTLGSFDKSREFDKRQRRVLTAMSWGLNLLNTERPFLSSIKDKDKMIQSLLKTIDNHFYEAQLGLKLYTIPIPNNHDARFLVGRMGIVPSGCAENGEYHHAQIMMHCFRSKIKSEINNAWKQFKPMISATRDETLCGPFETPTTSYTSDPQSPHFGKGMYFGLSGSVDWIINYFQQMAGVKLQLHDNNKPDVVIEPHLPSELKNTLSYQRIVHLNKNGKGYKRIPLRLEVKPTTDKPKILINGKISEMAVIQDISKYSQVNVEIYM